MEIFDLTRLGKNSEIITTFQDICGYNNDDNGYCGQQTAVDKNEHQK